jgi:hypothetical protein
MAEPVWVFQVEEPGVPSLRARPLGRDFAGRGLGQVVQHLPADGGVPSSSQSIGLTAAAFPGGIPLLPLGFRPETNRR